MNTHSIRLERDAQAINHTTHNILHAQYVCDYIMKGGVREEFMQKFSKAASEGFDPDTMLVKVGLANQTTMLKVGVVG